MRYNVNKQEYAQREIWMIKITKDSVKRFLRKKRIDTLKKEYIRICLIYMIIGITWVFFSDALAMRLFTDKKILLLVNNYKGYLFITVTTIVLYILIEKLIKKVQLAERQLNKSNDELREANEELQSYLDQLTETEEELRAQYEQILDYDKSLGLSEEKYKTLVNQMQLGLGLYEGKLGDDILNYRLIDANSSHEILTGLKKEKIMDMLFKDIHTYMEFENIVKMRRTIKTGEPCRYERYRPATDIYYEILCYKPKENQMAVIINDISERKKLEQRLQFLSYHDQLTGLYNRRFFLKEMDRLDCARYMPLTVTMADVNGLKLINDTFGHTVGDEYIRKIAEIMKIAFRPEDIVCRLAGDEFVILSPNTSEKEADKLIQQYHKLAKNEAVHSVQLSLSIGYSTKKDEEEHIREVYKKAEDYMYKKKIFESPSMRGRTINTMISTLHEKNPREELHSRRVSELCEKMGYVLELSEDKVKELKTVGLLHDIGKIAIEEGILNKPGKLTSEEWEEIKKHPEIGYRILNTVNDMSEMADYVLAHHERWDGKGYPKGLKGQEIPMEASIIAIADTYDAIVSERSYRSALSKEFAISELTKNSGTQFCPDLVHIFVEKVL
jgi:diguanylate cyclase (GGDEF) domain